MNEIQWIVACVAPWAVAPHPNFSQEQVDEPSLLALVSEFRLEDLDRYGSKLDAQYSPFGEQLVDAAAKSLTIATIEDAALRLRTLSSDSTLPMAARGAASLFASVAFTDLQRPLQAIQLLENLLEDIRQMPLSAKPALVRAFVSLQLAVKHMELDDRDSALTTIEVVLADTTTDFSAPADPDFPLSRGIDARSSDVLQDLNRTARLRAMRMKVLVAGPRDRTWIDIVRSRPTWTDEKLTSAAAERDRRAATSEFKRQADSIFGRTTISGDSAPEIRLGYAAALQAELGSDYPQILQGRESLGRILLRNRALRDFEHVTRETLRLMRMSHSKDGVEVAIQEIRTDGPLSALKEAAQSLVGLLSTTRMQLIESDLRMLHGSVDLLNESDSRSALAALLSRLTSGPGNRSFELHRLIIRCVSSLARQVDADDQVASTMIGAIPRWGSLEPLSGALVRLVEAINWDNVDEATSGRWRDWLESANGNVDKDLYWRLVSLLPSGIRAPHVESLTALSGVDLVVAALDLEEWLPDVLSRTRDAASELLAALRRDSEGTAFLARTYDYGELAALVALRLNDHEFWLTLAEFLSDPDVGADYKARALDKLSARSGDIPQAAINVIRASWELLRQQRQIFTGGFSSEPNRFFPEALRLGGALRLEPKESLIETITEMAADSDSRIRVEAAKTIALSALTEDSATWGQVVLLQLMRDADLQVRSTAIQALALTLREQGALDAQVRSLLKELLGSDSVRQPLNVLAGLEVLARRGGVDLSDYLGTLSVHIETHPSRYVREAALRVLQVMRDEPA